MRREGPAYCPRHVWNFCISYAEIDGQILAHFGRGTRVDGTSLVGMVGPPQRSRGPQSKLGTLRWMLSERTHFPHLPCCSIERTSRPAQRHQKFPCVHPRSSTACARKPRARSQQSLQLAARLQFLVTAERGDHLLANLVAVTPRR